MGQILQGRKDNFESRKRLVTTVRQYLATLRHRSEEKQKTYYVYLADQMETWTRYPSLVKDLTADAAPALEQYCLLGRIGDFQEAEDIWTKKLKQYASSFLYSISYLDNVLRQSRYGSAANYLEDYQASLLSGGNASIPSSQQRVLSVMQAYLNVFRRGWLRGAITAVRDTLEGLSTTKIEDYDDFQIHTIELCMHILKYAQNMSTYTTLQDLTFPSGEYASSGIPWSGYQDWAASLTRRGYLWEAINVIKILASTQKLDWSLEAYKKIHKIITTLQSSTHIELSRAALLIAWGRRFIANSALDKSMQCIDEAQSRLSKIEKELGRICSRQRIELNMANLELQSTALDVQANLQRWSDISISAREKLEWGIESTCLTLCSQIAAANRMNEKLHEYSKRLQIIEQDLEEDMQSVLTNRCSLWRAGDREHTAELLRWFDDHEEKHPLSGFLLENPKDGDMQRWDIPLSSARMIHLRYLIYSALGDVVRASSNQSIAAKIIKQVPWGRVMEMGLADKYTLEWLDPLSSQPTTPFEVLSRRIKIRYPDLAVNDGSDWYRYRQLYPTELQNVFLSYPFDQVRFESKVTTLNRWFENDDALDQRSSYYLIARLYLEHYAHAKLMAQDLQVMENIVTKFSEFVGNLSKSSYEVQQSLKGNVLLAWQELYDMKLKTPNINPTQAQNLRKSYENLITQYEKSHLANNLPIIGSLHGRIAEINFRLASSEIALRQAMQSLLQALDYYDNFRISFSVLKGLPALEIKASIRQGSVGDHEVLHRALSVLMTKWVNPGIPGNIKACISSLVWDIVQMTKNRALTDALSSENILSANDRAAIESNPGSAECYNGWQNALEALCLAMQKRDSKAFEIFQAQETIRIEEQKMMADPLCAKVIALNKGAPPSTSDMSKLFLGDKERVILVDWFTADTPVATHKLFMVTIEVSPEPKPPRIHNLELGIAGKIFGWNNKYLKAENAAANRKSSAAYGELKQLAGLVNPLAEISQPNDILVFCPTTKWNLHRIPLHAIEMAPSKLTADQKLSDTENLPMLRNLIVYTYSQSLLRLSVIARQSEVSEQNWHATTLSPLASNLSSEEAPLFSHFKSSPARKQASSVAASREIFRTLSAFSKFLSPSSPRNSHPVPTGSSGSINTLLTSNSVTKSLTLRTLPKTTFLTFLGHVHLASMPLASHLLLHHPLSNIICPNASGGAAESDPETFLSGRDIVGAARLAPGAHVVLLACGSGVTEAVRVQDEVLGLVPAFFHAGARSVVATLWDVQSETACGWLSGVQGAWESMERMARRKGDPDGMINLARVFRNSVRTLINQDGRAGIDSWASFVYCGFWRYPRGGAEVWDSEEEDI